MWSETKLKWNDPCVEVYIDNEKVPFCNSITKGENNELQFNFSNNKQTYVIENIKGLDLSQYLGLALIVLRNELLRHGDIYDAFSSSVKSAMNDEADKMNPEWPNIDDLTVSIMKRIIGEEECENKSNINDGK